MLKTDQDAGAKGYIIGLTAANMKSISREGEATFLLIYIAFRLKDVRQEILITRRNL